MSAKIPTEEMIKQMVMDDVRKVMNTELNERGITEAMLVEIDIADDFNDEIYLVAQIIINDMNNISFVDMFKLVHVNINSFINNYLRDNIMIGRLDKYLSDDIKEKIFILY